MPDLETRRLDQAILSFIQRTSEWPASELEFQSLAFKVFRYQFGRNEHYRNFCLLEKKLPKKIKSWKEIPAIPTVGFKELVLATFPISRAIKVFRTSGTTLRRSLSRAEPRDSGQAQSLRGAHFFDSLKLYEAAIVPSFKKYLLPDGAVCSYFFLIRSPRQAPDSSLSHMGGVVNRKFAGGCGRTYIKEDKILFGNLIRDLKILKRPAFIFSTAFSLKRFLDYLDAKKNYLKLPKGSRLLETGGFKGRVKAISKHELYAQCEKYLGINKNFCISEYGMTELSSQFYDTRLFDQVNGVNRKPFQAGPSWVRTLVVNPRTGQEARKGDVGVMRHFDLANRGSVVAIQTEDLARVVGEGFELIGRAKNSELRGCSLTYEEFLKT